MVSDLVVVALGAVLGLFALWRLPKQWRGDDHVRPDPPSGFPLGPRGWRAVLRSSPAILVGWWLGLELIVVDALSEPSAATDAVVSLLAVLLLVDLVVVVAVVVRTRPRWAVPPPLRDTPGLFADHDG